VFDRLGVRPGVIYDPFFLAGVAGDSALNQADGIHPNPEGVRRIVARLIPLVERLLAEVRAS
jgi:acyl-CoA thioesterase-1